MRVAIVEAIREVKLNRPPTDCLSPLGSEAVEAALAADGASLLNDQERSAIESALDGIKKSSNNQDYRDIKRAIEQLDKASAELAARRMNATIKSALAGHKLEEFSN